jgi:secretion/DNA translocation related CpaE-like protein
VRHRFRVTPAAAQEATMAARSVRSTPDAAPHGRRPLVVTSDPDLLDDLLRLAHEAGAVVDVSPDPAGARRWYGGAPLVLVGIDAAATCVRAGLPRRPGVVVVGRREEAVPRDLAGPHALPGPHDLAGRPDLAGPPDWPMAEELGADHIAVLPAAEPWLVDRLTRMARTGLARTVAVLGGRGGAGASVLAAGLAVTGARAGLRTLLVDADPLGGGVDLVLGWESLDGLRWPALSETSGRISPPALVEVLPRRGELVVLSWDRGDVLAVPAEAMATALDAGRRGQDLVVVDLPRRLDDASMLALAAADQGYLVVPAELRACAAAARVAALAAPHCPSLSAVVRGPAPGGLRGPEVAQALGLPLAGSLRPEPGLARGLECGQAPARDGRGPLATLCQRLLRELGLDIAAAAA